MRHGKAGLWSVLLLTLVVTWGCGGGDDDDIPSECINGCNVGCSRAVECQFIPASQVTACVNSCVDTIEDEGQATVQSCQSVTTTFLSATCPQLADLLGLPRNTSAPRSESPGAEEPGVFAIVVQGLITLLTQGK